MNTKQIEKNVVQSLERSYIFLMEEENKKIFYLALAQYGELIKDNDILKIIANDLENQIIINYKRYHPQSQYDQIKLFLSQYNKKDNKKEKKKKTNKKKETIKPNILQKKEMFPKTFSEKRNLETWGSWERLFWVYSILIKNQHPKLLLNNIVKNHESSTKYNLPPIGIELHSFRTQLISIIKNNNDSSNIEQQNFIDYHKDELAYKMSDPKKIEDFKYFLKNAHQYFINEIMKNSEEIAKNKNKNNLKINTFKIKIKKNKNIIGDISKHKWEDITISFIDKENVNIWIDDALIGKYSFIELGMGKRKPNRIWKFLKALSIFNLKEYGDEGVKPTLSKLLKAYDSKDIIEKLVSDSNDALKELFAKPENPFFKYKDFKEYRTKFKLKPQSIDNFKKNDFQNEELDENSSYDGFEIYQ